MPRNENCELKNELEETLIRQLQEQGLNATTYKSIADDLGISRALVQHYYPKKIDFALFFLETLMSEAAKTLGIDSYSSNERLNVEDAYLLGCLYYGYLLDDEGGSQLLFDILKDRELSDELMRAHYEWGLENIDPTRPDFESRSHDVITTWGGFYELMYMALKQGFDPDLPKSSIPLLVSFLADSSEVHINADKLRGMHIDPTKLGILKNVMKKR